MGGISSMEETSNSYKILIGKLYRKKSVGRPRSRWGRVLKWIKKSGM
jgi:hypothetical protein